MEQRDCDNSKMSLARCASQAKGNCFCWTLSAPTLPVGHKQPIRVNKYLQLLFTFALCPTGLGSSHFVVRMVASLCIICGTFPVWRISIRVDFPCRGGPMTIIFISLHFSALRSCARKYASTVLGPTVRGEEDRLYLWFAVTNAHL